MSTYTDAYDEKPGRLDESSMSFLDHLDELRKRIVRCALFIAVAFAVCWAFSDKIYHFLEIPVRRAMAEAKRSAATDLKQADTVVLGDLADGTPLNFTFRTDCQIADRQGASVLIPVGTTMPVKVQHGSDGNPELAIDRDWFMNDQFIVKEGWVVPRTLYDPNVADNSPDNKLIVLTAQGAFNLYIKVSFYAAIFFTVPFLLWQAWLFIAPGLYPHEKKYAIPFIAMASVFFLLGCAFAYWIAFPRAANFLLGVAANGNLRPQLTADDYFDLINTIMLGLGLVFEIPTVTFFMSRLGLVTPRMLLIVWRYAVIVIFILAAVLSPTTDIPNMLVFAAPMLMLYFFSVGIAWVFYKKRQTEREAREAREK